MFWIVYKTTNKINKKIYVGVHKQADPNVFDGYLGRGLSTYNKHYYLYPCAPFHYAVVKYGFENFKRETLFIFDNEKQAYAKEAEIVDAAFVNRNDTYNVALGGGRSHPIKGAIYQFDLKGNFIKVFNCITEASLELHISESAIATSAREKKARRNYLFSFDSKINISEYYIKKINTYNIYDLSGNLIKENISNKDCCLFLNTDRGNLSRAIKHGYKINNYKVLLFN